MPGQRSGSRAPQPLGNELRRSREQNDHGAVRTNRLDQVAKLLRGLHGRDDEEHAPSALDAEARSRQPAGYPLRCRKLRVASRQLLGLQRRECRRSRAVWSTPRGPERLPASGAPVRTSATITARDDPGRGARTPAAHAPRVVGGTARRRPTGDKLRDTTTTPETLPATRPRQGGPTAARPGIAIRRGGLSSLRQLLRRMQHAVLAASVPPGACWV